MNLKLKIPLAALMCIAAFFRTGMAQYQDHGEMTIPGQTSPARQATGIWELDPLSREATSEVFFYMGGFSIDEIFIPDIAWRKDENTWETGDLNMKLSNCFMIGVGLQYNYTEHLALKLDVDYSYPHYEGEWNGKTIGGHAHIAACQLSGVINFLKGPITPYAAVGIGFFYLDTRIPNEEPYWEYDEEWGETLVQPTKDKTYFSYHLSVGIRWDFSQTGSISISGTSNWLNVGGAAGQVRSTKIMLGMSYRM